MRENISPKKKGDSLAASEINTLADLASRAGRFRVGTYLSSKHSGSYMSLSNKYPFDCTVLIITNTKIYASDTDNSGLYLGKTRYYSYEQEAWATDEAEWVIDARDTGTTYAVDNKLTAYWDEQRGTFVPVIAAAKVCDFIRFEIVEVGTNARGIRWADVDILSRPVGCSVVPEEIEESGSSGSGSSSSASIAEIQLYKVYDMAGCFLNEPDLDLIGRIGYAKYLQDERFIDEAIEPGDDYPDPAWEIISLCCPSCEVV